MVSTASAIRERISGWRIGVVGVVLVIGAGCTVALHQLGWPLDLLYMPVVAYLASYLIAGTIAWIRQPDNPTGLLMLAAAAAGSLSFWSLHPDELVWRAAILAGGVANVLVATIILSAPAGRIERRGHWIVLGAWAVVLVAISFPLPDDLLVAGRAVGLGLALVLAGAAIARWHGATRPQRRSLSPVVAASVLFCLVHAVNFASAMLSIPGGPGTPIQIGDTIARALIPFGFLLGILRLRIARGAVAQLVVELGQTPTPNELRNALAGALGDQTLEVLYWSPAVRSYLNANGVPLDLEADTTGRAVIQLERAGRPLAAILHDPALADDPGLVAAVGAAVRLAVDNERLSAEVQEQLADVRASRARLVEASDAARHRVERDLHDGAQQRLVALSLALRHAESLVPAESVPELRRTLQGASNQLSTALRELRELAKGIHPAILTEAGLAAALRSLARESPVPVRLSLSLEERFPPQAEAAAYFVAAESLANAVKYAAATGITFAAAIEDDALHIEVTDDGRGGADPRLGSGLRGLQDRVAALGGTFEVRSVSGSGTTVAARLPRDPGVVVMT